MTKSNITVSVETEIVEESRKKGINISEAAEAGIANAVGMGGVMESRDRAEREDKFREVFDSLTKQEKVGIINALNPDNGNKYVEGWIKIIKLKTGKKFTTLEIKDLYDYVKEQQAQPPPCGRERVRESERDD